MSAVIALGEPVGAVNPATEDCSPSDGGVDPPRKVASNGPFSTRQTVCLVPASDVSGDAFDPACAPLSLLFLPRAGRVVCLSKLLLPLYTASLHHSAIVNMKAVGVKNGKGNADALYIEDGVPDPVPTGNRILVRIKAFGLNRMDIMQREDRYPYPLLPESGKIMGVEFSGIVEEKGPDCELVHSSLREH